MKMTLKKTTKNCVVYEASGPVFGEAAIVSTVYLNAAVLAQMCKAAGHSDFPREIELGISLIPATGKEAA